MAITEIGNTFTMGGLVTPVDNVSYVLSDGRIVHVWQNQSFSVDTQFRTYFAVYGSDGAELTAPQLVSTEAGVPAAGTLGFTESVYAVSTNSSGDIQFHYNRWFPGVVNFGDPTLSVDPFNDNFTRSFTSAGVAINDGIDTGFGVQWTQRNSTSVQLSDNRIAVFSDGDLTILNADGTYAGPNATAPQNDVPIPTSADISIVETSTGIFTILLSQANGGSLIGQFYDLNGTVQGSAFDIVTQTGMDSFAFSLASQSASAEVLADGRIAVAWTGTSSALGDTDSTGIYGAILNADGSINVDTFLINVGNIHGGQFAPRIHSLDDGTFVVSYQSIAFSPSIQHTGLLQQFAADGSVIGETVELVERFHNGHNTIILSDGTGIITGLDGQSQAIMVELGSVVPPADNVINGTPNADVLNGTDGADTIYGLADNDRIISGNGNDTLYGGDGADTLNAGDGDDFIFGGDTSADLRDVVFAGAGNDSVDGGYGNDLISGQDGDDTIAGGFGADTLNGQNGNDVLTGSAFSDLVSGNAGDDFVNGGFGNDRINGGSGADRFFHLGILDHGSDFIQDYTAADGDILLSGIAGAMRSDFQVNINDAVAPNGEAAGDDNVQEAFVIYRPTGQILWALIDGAGQSEINIRIGTDTFDLLM